METKKEDEIYCPECGKAIKRAAVICVNCGIQIKKLDTVTSVVRVEQEITPKIKTVAIVLAFFFSFWAWLYTYKRNSLKFWITLGALAVLYVSYISYACSNIAMAFDVNSNAPVADYSGFTILFYIASFGIWLWVLIDSWTKPQSFYINYPKGV